MGDMGQQCFLDACVFGERRSNDSHSDGRSEGYIL